MSGDKIKGLKCKICGNEDLAEARLELNSGMSELVQYCHECKEFVYDTDATWWEADDVEDVIFVH